MSNWHKPLSRVRRYISKVVSSVVSLLCVTTLKRNDKKLLVKTFWDYAFFNFSKKCSRIWQRYSEVSISWITFYIDGSSYPILRERLFTFHSSAEFNITCIIMRYHNVFSNVRKSRSPSVTFTKKLIISSAHIKRLHWISILFFVLILFSFNSTVRDFLCLCQWHWFVTDFNVIQNYIKSFVLSPFIINSYYCFS